MTFLELCQRVANESGVMAGNRITLVTDQTGRTAKVIGWVRDAYTSIQRERVDWTWMYGDFSGDLLFGVREYNGAALGIDRLSSWVVPDEGSASMMTVYDPVLDRQDEEPLYYLPWLAFRQQCLSHGNARYMGKPTAFTVLPDNKLSLFPRPDKTFKMRGVYRKSAQILKAADEVPEMPADFHELIVWRALLLLAVHDEAGQQSPIWAAEAARITSDLVNRHTPTIEMGIERVFH